MDNGCGYEYGYGTDEGKEVCYQCQACLTRGAIAFNLPAKCFNS